MLSFGAGTVRTATRLQALSPQRARAEWQSFLRTEVAGVGMRVYCEDSLMAACAASTPAELYERLSSATANELGGACAAEFAWPADRELSAEQAVRYFSSEEARFAGYFVLQAPLDERRGEFGAERWRETTTCGQWQVRVEGVESTARVLEHVHPARGAWRSLTLEPLA